MQQEGWGEIQAGCTVQEKAAVFGVLKTSRGVVASVPHRIYSCVARKILRNKIYLSNSVEEDCSAKPIIT